MDELKLLLKSISQLEVEELKQMASIRDIKSIKKFTRKELTQYMYFAGLAKAYRKSADLVVTSINNVKQLKD